MFTSTTANNILALALVTAIGLPSTTTMRVQNMYICQNEDVYIKCDVQSASHSKDRSNTNCQWWQNDVVLNRSSKYRTEGEFYSNQECCLTIKDVQKPDAHPTDYRCSDGDRVGRVIFRLWLRVEPLDAPVLTVGGQALADGEMLNLATLSHLHPPPIIQCSAGRSRRDDWLNFQLQHSMEPMEAEMDWIQLETSKMPGYLFKKTIRMLANDTQLVPGRNLSCTITRKQCQTHKWLEDSLEIIIIGKLSSKLTTSATTTPMRVINQFTCQNDDAYIFCDILQSSHSNDSNGTECRWWQNNKELSRSAKYMIDRYGFKYWNCYLTISDVHEKVDAQPTDYRCSDGDRVGRVTFRLWFRVEPPVNSLVLTIGGKTLPPGGMLNLTALSQIHPPPIIQCSASPSRQADWLIFQLQHSKEPMEATIDWQQFEISKVPGYLFKKTIRMLANDTQLVAGRNLSCTASVWQCQTHEPIKESLEIIIIGKYEMRLTPQLSAATTTNSVVAVFVGGIVALHVIWTMF